MECEVVGSNPPLLTLTITLSPASTPNHFIIHMDAQVHLHSLLVGLTVETFNEHLHIEFNRALMAPSTAGEESRWVWEHIRDHTQDWGYRRRFSEALRSLQHAELIKWYEQYLSRDGGLAARLTVHAEAACEGEQQTSPEAVSIDDIEVWKSTMLSDMEMHRGGCL